MLSLNVGFSLWLQSVITKNPAPDPAFLAWGMQHEQLPVVALAYSVNPQDRLIAAYQLAALNTPPAGTLLAELIGDLNRDVHLAAMDALWNVTTTPDMIDALWTRAGLGLLAAAPPPNAAPPPPLLFYGHALHFSPQTPPPTNAFKVPTSPPTCSSAPPPTLITSKLDALLAQAAQDEYPTALRYQNILP